MLGRAAQRLDGAGGGVPDVVRQEGERCASVEVVFGLVRVPLRTTYVLHTRGTGRGAPAATARGRRDEAAAGAGAPEGGEEEGGAEKVGSFVCVLVLPAEH